MRSILNGQCYNVPLQILFETLHIKRKGDLSKDTIGTMSLNDDKYLVQWETRSTKSRKFLNF